jgi:cobalamin biosynthesis Mg chelatase CobN
MAAVPVVAAAQDDGVFFDPGGPSEKEYAIPHEQARGGGGDAPSSSQSGGSGGAGSSGADVQSGTGNAAAETGDAPDAPLFGEGVSPPKAGRSAQAQARAQDGAGGAGSVVEISAASTKTNSTTGLSWFVVIAAAVVLAGGGLAYLIRARAHRQAP